MKKLLVPFLLPFIMFSCGEDDKDAVEPEVDFREAVVADYSYVGSIDLQNQEGSARAEGTLRVEKLSTSGFKFIFDAGTDGEFEINASGVAEATNGVGFNLSNKILTTPDYGEYQMSGVTTFDVGGVDYHGFYDTGRKQIEFNAEADYVNNEYDEYNYDMHILATKK